MVPLFSPRVPGINTAHRGVLAGQRIFKASSWVLRQLVKPSLLLLLLFSPAFLTAPPCLAQSPTQRVLIVTGYDPSHPAVGIILRSLTATISNGSKERIEFFYEIQENLRIPARSMKAKWSAISSGSMRGRS